MSGEVQPTFLKLFVLSAVVAGWACTSPGSGAIDAYPRIVLVSLDTLHVNRTSVYNEDVELTPFMERFAGEGVHFAHAFTQTATTLPSHASLMTGMSPTSLGVMVNGDHVPETSETLAEILGRAGYRTAAFISLGVLRPSFGIAQGFEHFEDPFPDGPGRWYRWADEVLGPVGEWLAAHHDEPFFLWVHLSDPHEPYVTVDAAPDVELWLDDVQLGSYNIESKDRFTVDVDLTPGAHRLKWVSLREPREDDRPDTSHELIVRNADALARYTGGVLEEAWLSLEPEAVVELESAEAASVEVVFTGRLRQPPASTVIPAYDANVAYLDRHLAELDEMLDEHGIRDDTLVLMVSDHGEGLYVHHILGHAGQVYEDQMRILWMMRGPGLPRGKVIDERPALTMNVAPTLLELIGLPAPETEGESLLGCIEGNDCPDAEPWWSFGVDPRGRRLTTMASYEWPYKWLWRRNFPRGGFDLSSDPWEENDLLTEKNVEHAQELRRAAESFREARKLHATTLRRGSNVVTPEQQRMLESLGYLGGGDR